MKHSVLDIGIGECYNNAETNLSTGHIFRVINTFYWLIRQIRGIVSELRLYILVGCYKIG
jgi:hypothetical protein